MRLRSINTALLCCVFWKNLCNYVILLLVNMRQLYKYWDSNGWCKFIDTKYLQNDLIMTLLKWKWKWPFLKNNFFIWNGQSWMDYQGPGWYLCEMSQDGSSVQKFQKQTFRGVLRKRCSGNMWQIYRRTLMPKCDFSKVVEIWLVIRKLD